MEPSRIIRTANQSDVAHIKYFLSRKPFLHRHLDWREPLDWIGAPNFLLRLDKREQIEAMFCCTPEIGDMYWLRIFACKHQSTANSVWQSLFTHFITTEKINHSKTRIFSLAYQTWTIKMLEIEGWEKIGDIVQFEMCKNFPTEQRKPHQNHNIRRMKRYDLKQAYVIDHDSFAGTWQLSFETFQLSFNQSEYATVYVDDGKILGFQISTIQNNRAHLARIVVDINHRGRHIGKSLVVDFLEHCDKENIQNISVNTQKNNRNSISLYQGLGFTKKSEIYPVFAY